MKFYVYEWYIVKTNEVIYVGKGTNNRYKVKKRNSLFNQAIKENVCDVRIVKYFDDESEAFDYEYDLYTYYKNINQARCNLKYCGNGGVAGIWTEEMRSKMSKYNPMKSEKQRIRMSINNPMKIKQIQDKVKVYTQRRVVINGIEYESCKIAAEKIGVCDITISKWCKRGYDTNFNPCKYYDEEQKEFKIKITNSMPVIVDNNRFNSVKEAAIYYDTWSETIIRAIKGNRKFKGMECKYDNQQPSIEKPVKVSMKVQRLDGEDGIQ